MAWCVWDASNTRGPLKDIPRNKLIPASAHANKNGTGEQLVDLAVAGATAGGLLNAAPGLSRGADVTMILLGALLGDGQSRVGRNDLLAWMPADLAGTADEALALYEKTVLDATKNAFPGCTFVDVTLPPQPANTAYSLMRKDLKGYLLTGDACAFDGRTLAQMRDGRYFNDGTVAKAGKAPGWLGGYQAWTFNFPSMRILELIEGDRYASWRYVPALSKHLPPWVFVTLSAENASLGVQMNIGLKLTLVYNEGRATAAIFPDSELVDPLKHMGAAK